ncbi:MAG TPA: transglutaminase-like domain-containing protein [Methylomirabilota bacterium]|nr:transglutaminase-like domain-containing protein [Methylomirabilota bacterium]
MIADPPLREFSALTGGADDHIDLARAALAIARWEYPTLEVDAYVERLDGLARCVDGPRRSTDPLGRLHRLREYLFVEQGFAGNREDYYDPRNSFLNDVLDRRQGNPITLSLVLMEVGKRLGLAVEGIGLPGHFIAGARFGDSQILLDPFNAGGLLTPEVCEKLVGRALGRKVALKPEHFAAVTRRQFLARMLANLKGIYWQREAWDRVVGVIDRLLVLDPKAAGEWRDRGLAWTNLGEIRRGLVDWERYLTEFPNAADHDAVQGRLRKARQKLAQLN